MRKYFRHAILEVVQIRCVQSSGRKSLHCNSEILTSGFQLFYSFLFFLFITCSSPIKKKENLKSKVHFCGQIIFLSHVCERVLLLNALSAAGDRADRLWAGSLTVKSHRQGCWWLWQIAWLLCCGSASHSDFLNLIISKSFHEEMLWQAEILFQWLLATHTCLSK